MPKENEFLNEQEHAAYMDDFAKVVNIVVEKVIEIADKHNVDDNALQHFSTIFSAMVRMGTFKHFGENRNLGKYFYNGIQE